MEQTYSRAYLEKAHKATISNEQEILRSSCCVCLYCGHRFNPCNENLIWMEEGPEKERTLFCSICYADATIGDASGYPIDDQQFIKEFTEYWFNGYSRISCGYSLAREGITIIEVE